MQNLQNLPSPIGMYPDITKPELLRVEVHWQSCLILKITSFKQDLASEHYTSQMNLGVIFLITKEHIK